MIWCVLYTFVLALKLGGHHRHLQFSPTLWVSQLSSLLLVQPFDFLYYSCFLPQPPCTVQIFHAKPASSQVIVNHYLAHDMGVLKGSIILSLTLILRNVDTLLWHRTQGPVILPEFLVRNRIKVWELRSHHRTPAIINLPGFVCRCSKDQTAERERKLSKVFPVTLCAYFIFLIRI